MDITRDVMRMKQAGKSVADIRKYVDASYSKYGPPTPTPAPPKGR